MSPWSDVTIMTVCSHTPAALRADSSTDEVYRSQVLHEPGQLKALREQAHFTVSIYLPTIASNSAIMA